MKIINLVIIIWFIYVMFNIYLLIKEIIKNENFKEKKREKNKKKIEKK